MCACMCLRVHVCLREEEEDEEEQDGSLILLSRFQVHPGEDPGAAAAPWWRWSAVRD